MRTLLPVGAAVLFAMAAATSAIAKPDRFAVEVKVIEAVPGPGPAAVDPRLKSLAKDLSSLPFKEVKLFDAHSTSINEGEKLSFEFPGKGKEKRFLEVQAHGKQKGGKLRFQLSIDQLKFDTLVAVPEGGTIIVAGPKHEGRTLMFAVTAKGG